MSGSDHSSDKDFQSLDFKRSGQTSGELEVLEGLSILACYPDDRLLYTLEDSFRPLKINLLTAKTGEHALYELRKRIKKEGRLDLLMIGENSGDISTAIVIGRIREYLEWKMPIILMAKEDSVSAVASQEKEEIDARLTIPFSEDCLLRTIKEIVNKERSPHSGGVVCEKIKHIVKNKADGYLLPASLPGINVKKLLDQLDLEFELIKKILQGFLENTPEILNELEKGFSQKEWQVVRERAHNIKGSAANIGADHLQQTCRKIEFLCDKTIQESAREPQAFFLSDLRTAYKRLIGSIDWLLSDEVRRLQQRELL